MKIHALMSRSVVVAAAVGAATGIVPATASADAPPAHNIQQVARWQSLPATPAAPRGGRAVVSEVNGVKLFHAEYGKGSPVILLHGGPANSDYLAKQVEALRANHRVIVMDTRGHGRSAMDSRPLGYDLFANDVVKLMDQLKIQRADIVGWSDGGITALDVAMRYPERSGRIVAFGANTNTDGVHTDAGDKPVFATFLKRAEKEYARLSPTPKGFAALNEKLGAMYSTQPDWTDAQLRTIRAKVLIMDGDHDEAIKREHTEYIARTIPGAQLRILPDTSHFAFLQDPVHFNRHLTQFLR